MPNNKFKSAYQNLIMNEAKGSPEDMIKKLVKEKAKEANKAEKSGDMETAHDLDGQAAGLRIAYQIITGKQLN